MEQPTTTTEATGVESPKDEQAPLQRFVHPYFEQDGVTIYNADCLKVLPWIGAFDLLLTDPPFNVRQANLAKGNGTLRGAGRNSGTLDFGSWDEHFKPSDFVESLRMMPQAYIFSSDKLVAEWFAELMAHYSVLKLLTWVKPDPLPQCRQRHWVSASEHIVWAARDDYTFNFLGHSEMFSWTLQQAPKQERYHPTEKPLAICRKLIAVSSNVGDVVIDPFMGSGTTLVAAKLDGRRAVGIEIEERYCEIAANRLRQGVLPFVG